MQHWAFFYIQSSLQRYETVQTGKSKNEWVCVNLAPELQLQRVEVHSTPKQKKDIKKYQNAYRLHTQK